MKKGIAFLHPNFRNINKMPKENNLYLKIIKKNSDGEKKVLQVIFLLLINN